MIQTEGLPWQTSLKDPQGISRFVRRKRKFLVILKTGGYLHLLHHVGSIKFRFYINHKPFFSTAHGFFLNVFLMTLRVIPYIFFRKRWKTKTNLRHSEMISVGVSQQNIDPGIKDVGTPGQPPDSFQQSSIIIPCSDAPNPSPHPDPLAGGPMSWVEHYVATDVTASNAQNFTV